MESNSKPNQNLNYDVIIIGSGPAGMAAAVFLKRSKVSVLVLEMGTPGGKLLITSQIENYPGFMKNTGVELASIMYQQLRDESIERKHEEVLDVIRNREGDFMVKTRKNDYQANFVIFAGGSRLKSLGIPGEEKFKSRGLSFCALCDGNQYENEDVVVIGGGTSGFEEALYLTKICKSVTIISRSEKFKANEHLIEKANKTKNLFMVKDKDIKEFVGGEHLEGVVVEDKITGVTETIKAKGAFIYIGFDPTSIMLEKYGILDEKGYIYVDETRETKVPRLYAAGDCVHKFARQVITAVSDGVVAAISIIRKI